MSPAELRRWLLETALPFWLEHGVAWQQGSFIEELHQADLRARAAFRRLRVAARQVERVGRRVDHPHVGAARLGL
jgi:mannose-6-phosphate isomerase